MLPPCFDKEELSVDFQYIAYAVDESGSAVLFKNGMPVYQAKPYNASQVNTEAARHNSQNESVFAVVTNWMHHHAAAPDEIGINNLLLRLALAGMMLDCYTEELSSLDDLLERPEPQHDEIVAWILSHITK